MLPILLCEPLATSVGRSRCGDRSWLCLQSIARGRRGADDESSQEIRFVVDAVDPSAFAVQPTISPDGTLTYVTASDVNSNSGKNLTVTVYMLDNGVAGPAPDNNRSATKTFAVNVNPVNDSPVPDGFSTTANEDGSITITAVSVLAGDKPGPADESSQTLRIVQSERSSDNGGVVVPVFGAGGAITEFRYTPGANKAGLDFFRYVIADNGVPSRSATGTITISINPVNDAPQFTVGPTTGKWSRGCGGSRCSMGDECCRRTGECDRRVDWTQCANC